MPERADVADVYQYLRAGAARAPLHCQQDAFCCAVSAWSHGRHSVRRTLACLDILAELHFIELRHTGSALEIRLLPVQGKNPLENSPLYCALHQAAGE